MPQNELHSITLPKHLAESVDALINSTKGIFFSDIVIEALELYLLQLELAKAQNPKPKEGE